MIRNMINKKFSIKKEKQQHPFRYFTTFLVQYRKYIAMFYCTLLHFYRQRDP